MDKYSIVVVAGGVCKADDWLNEVVVNSDFVIGVDGGTDQLFKLDHAPDLFVGDKDSVSSEALAWLKKNDVEEKIFDVDKDFTDLELALFESLSVASELKTFSIKVVGAFGGRLDHEIANIMLLTKTDLIGYDISLIDPKQRLVVTNDQIDIDARVGDVVSLMPIGGNVRVERTRGLKWSLEEEVLVLGSSRGVSNLVVSEEVYIKVSSGSLLVLVINS